MTELTENPENKEDKKRFNPTLIVLAMLGLGFIIFVVMAPPGRMGGPPPVDSQAPAFELKDLSGNPWQLAALSGKVVVINFWASWCPPCKKEMPSLSKLSKLNLGRGEFQVLTILYQDDPENARAYFKEQGFEMPVLIDPRGKVAKLYGLAGVPETFVIGKKGILKKHFIGPVDFVSQDAREFIASLMTR